MIIRESKIENIYVYDIYDKLLHVIVQDNVPYFKLDDILAIFRNPISSKEVILRYTSDISTIRSWNGDAIAVIPLRIVDQLAYVFPSRYNSQVISLIKDLADSLVKRHTSSDKTSSSKVVDALNNISETLSSIDKKLSGLIAAGRKE